MLLWEPPCDRGRSLTRFVFAGRPEGGRARPCACPARFPTRQVRGLAQLQFDTRDRATPLRYATSLAGGMQAYPPQVCICVGMCMCWFDTFVCTFGSGSTARLRRALRCTAALAHAGGGRELLRVVRARAQALTQTCARTYTGADTNVCVRACGGWASLPQDLLPALYGVPFDWDPEAVRQVGGMGARHTCVMCDVYVARQV
jgi:hypothetical protein